MSDDIQENEDGSADIDLLEDDLDVEEQPDGSAIVHMEYKGPEEDADFYENLAETIDSWDLSKLALKYTDFIERDKEAREDRDKKYEEGLRRTGLGNDAPGGAQFEGASKVVHPVMAEACVDFASRAIKELFPPDGPVRTKILGQVTEEKQEVADRKRDYVNWQLTEQIEEFRDEQEQLLTQLPLGGSQFLKIWYDDQKRRPCVEFVPIDNIILPFAAANFYTAQRVTEVQDITEYEMDARIRRNLYRDVNIIRATLEPDMSHAEKANNKIEGNKYQDNKDGLRRVYHVYTWLELEEDSRTNGEMAPYILMIDELDKEVLGLYRNWEDGDETMTKLDWMVEFKFIPWRGAYAIGLPHLIGGLSAALTGALRALLDTAHINNSATMLKLKGAKISGQSQSIDVTQVVEIEGAAGVDDIRKVAMPLPFNPPSPVLFQLLGWLTDSAKGVVTTAEEKIADASSNMPVGTTQALIEQGAAVFSAIHARLHASQKKVLMIIGRINRWYLDDQLRGDVVEDLEVERSDFNRNSDIVPVSDPHIFSETQRIAQMQSVMQMAGQYPQLFDMKAVVSRMLKQLKVPDVPELMPDSVKPTEMDAAEENAAMALGHHAFAYPNQDHLAHIQAHMDFGLDPVLGGNILMGPQFIPGALEHIKQHMTLWYRDRMAAHSGNKTYTFADGDIKQDVKKIDHIIAMAAESVKSETQVMMPVIQACQQMIQMLQQFSPPQQPPPDPASQAMLQASMAETQRRTQRDQLDMQMKQAELQAEFQRQQAKDQIEVSEAQKDRAIEVALNAENNLTQERMKSAQVMADQLKTRQEQEKSVSEAEQLAQENLQ